MIQVFKIGKPVKPVLENGKTGQNSLGNRETSQNGFGKSRQVTLDSSGGVRSIDLVPE